MEPEGSLTHTQVLATCPYPEPARSYGIPQSKNTLSKYVIFIDFPLQK